MTAMSDLADGTRVRHVRWDLTGTIRVIGSTAEFRADDVFGDTQVSDEGPAFPDDFEIIPDGAP